ncbi:MAG: phage holin family protein [Candidatus Nitricoxidivorans perseverans]|uniref:Phage holin family protein n=1 Tax=Candidatus Nitricoxidivorans perseverans TaxID=2975601 RepID=A0AA49FK09_9PROT|nr:MAG: phage holin family protein [Candidatus Nitricoxidivorans perseverans]
MTGPGARSGLLNSLRSLLATAVALLKTRGELLAAELEEEKLRLLGLLLYGATAFLLLGVGAVFLAVFLTVLLWESHRLLVLGMFSAVFLTAGLIAWAVARRLACAKSRLFSDSLAELELDRAALESDESAIH